jgi:hypothetical protein
MAIRALKRFVCESFGPERRPPQDVLAAARDYVPEVSADAEEMAALLRAAARGVFEPVHGKPVAIVI